MMFEIPPGKKMKMVEGVTDLGSPHRLPYTDPIERLTLKLTDLKGGKCCKKSWKITVLASHFVFCFLHVLTSVTAQIQNYFQISVIDWCTSLPFSCVLLLNCTLGESWDAQLETWTNALLISIFYSFI